MVSLAPGHWAKTVSLIASPTAGPASSAAGPLAGLALPPAVLGSTRGRVRGFVVHNPGETGDQPAARVHRLVEELRGLGVVLRAEPEAVAPPLVVGSAEFNRRNERRHELIDKRVDHGLTAAEEAEFQRLQAEILRVTKARFPLPPLPRLPWLEANGRPAD